MVYEITEKDIGKKHIKYVSCPCCMKTNVISITDLMGHIVSYDVGKRIYKVGGVYQVENKEQLDKRLNASKREHLGMFISVPDDDFDGCSLDHKY